MCLKPLHTHATMFQVWICLGLPPSLPLLPNIRRRLADPAFRVLLNYLGALLFILLTDYSRREVGTPPGLQKQLVGLILCLLNYMCISSRILFKTFFFSIAQQLVAIYLQGQTHCYLLEIPWCLKDNLHMDLGLFTTNMGREKTLTDSGLDWC